MKCLAIEKLNYIKSNYEDQIINLVKNELISDFRSFESSGAKSLSFVFEEDENDHIFFDDNTGIIVSSSQSLNIKELIENSLQLENFHISSSTVNMINFIVENIKLDVDDYITISAKSVVFEIKSLKKQKSKDINIDNNIMKESNSTTDLNVQAAIDSLINQVQKMVEKSGDTTGFDSSVWVNNWINSDIPALGNKKPITFLNTLEGQKQIMGLLYCIQSGAYN